MSALHLRRTAPLDRRFNIGADAGIVAAVIIVWQAARIPVEGGAGESIAHAHEWLSVHRALGLSGLQNGVITLMHQPVLIDLARWSYGNLHVFGIFTFMVAFRAAAPDRYPAVRTAFVLLHIPALVAIAAFPLAPPQWLPHPGAWGGGVPVLHGTLSADLRNQTAAVASEHFGYPCLIAAATLWAAGARPLAWPVVLYPVWVFLVIVGTGHHYPLDAVVGALCVVFGFAVARALHGPWRAAVVTGEQARSWIPLALGAGLLGGWADALFSGRLHATHPSVLAFAAPVAAALAFTIRRAVR
jgi:hypothetical protein